MLYAGEEPRRHTPTMYKSSGIVQNVARGNKSSVLVKRGGRTRGLFSMASFFEFAPPLQHAPSANGTVSRGEANGEGRGGDETIR